MPEPELSPEEKVLFTYTNIHRMREKKKPLKLSPKLMEIARQYAQVMAKEGVVDDELDAKNYSKRVADAGYKFKNDLLIFNATGGANYTPEGVWTVWSENAVANMNMLGDYEETGIGIAKKENVIFFYVLYAVPEK